MIEVQKLCTGYGGRMILRDVSIAFLPGKVTVLLGPNGCGKSTLIKSTLGLMPLLGGQVLLDGVALAQLSPRQIAQKAAYLSQSRNIPSITARRMVLHGRFPYLSYPRRYRPEDFEMIKRSLAMADASDLADRSMMELSGGQRQKVYLAMALAQDTATIFMDEPTTYLDARHQLEVMTVARRLADQGKAVVLVLHDLGLALHAADIAAVFADGTLLKTGTPEELFCSGILNEVFEITLKRVRTEDGWKYYYL